jgi:hypothetical protein
MRGRGRGDFRKSFSYSEMKSYSEIFVKTMNREEFRFCNSFISMWLHSWYRTCILQIPIFENAILETHFLPIFGVFNENARDHLVGGSFSSQF